jgi:hypothetical protein
LQVWILCDQILRHAASHQAQTNESHGRGRGGGKASAVLEEDLSCASSGLLKHLRDKQNAQAAHGYNGLSDEDGFCAQDGSPTKKQSTLLLNGGGISYNVSD